MPNFSTRLLSQAAVYFLSKLTHLDRLDTAPRRTWKVQQLRDWLRAKSIKVPLKANHLELWRLCQEELKNDPQYSLVEAAEKHHLEIGILPPMHPKWY